MDLWRRSIFHRNVDEKLDQILDTFAVDIDVIERRCRPFII
jgi:hypothetical protein